MSESMRAAISAAQDALQRLAITMIVAAALVLTGYSIACALGLAPWLEMIATLGEVVYPKAGMIVQLAVTALALTLCFYLSANTRIMSLETSHRSFHIGMRDVTQAYTAAHRSDREDVFHLQSEFDSIRERMAFLRSHPDLLDLEAGVIEVAAQMSHISRELADTYSDAKVSRARDFLIQRQQEIEDFNDRLAEAKAVSTELKRWHSRVEIEEDVARSQLEWLREELAELLPELTEPAAPETPVAIPADTTPEPVWPDVPDPEDGDSRIVALLARRAAR